MQDRLTVDPALAGCIKAPHANRVHAKDHCKPCSSWSSTNSVVGGTAWKTICQAACIWYVLRLDHIGEASLLSSAQGGGVGDAAA